MPVLTTKTRIRQTVSILTKGDWLNIADTLASASGVADYESAETALDNDAQISFTHSLVAIPRKVRVILRANTATAQGWADNEEGEFSFPYQGALADDGVDLTWDATNIYITQGANIQLLDHGSFDHETITQTEYDWVVRAWL